MKTETEISRALELLQRDFLYDDEFEKIEENIGIDITNPNSYGTAIETLKWVLGIKTIAQEVREKNERLRKRGKIPP